MAEQVKQQEAKLGLDQPLPVQYGRYVARLAHGRIVADLNMPVPACGGRLSTG